MVELETPLLRICIPGKSLHLGGFQPPLVPLREEGEERFDL